MRKEKMHIRHIQTLTEASEAIKEIGSDPASIPIMAPKLIHRVIQLDDIKLQDAIIIKQDMLSIGGEVCVPKHTFDLHQEKATIMVSGTIHQHRMLINKLKRHYPRIQRIAKSLKELVETIS